MQLIFLFMLSIKQNLNSHEKLFYKNVRMFNIFQKFLELKNRKVLTAPVTHIYISAQIGSDFLIPDIPE